MEGPIRTLELDFSPERLGNILFGHPVYGFLSCSPALTLVGELQTGKQEPSTHSTRNQNNPRLNCPKNRIYTCKRKRKEKSGWGELLHSISRSTQKVILNRPEHACALRHVQLFATPWTVARQAPLCRGFFRQEYWNGLPFPL